MRITLVVGSNDPVASPSLSRACATAAMQLAKTVRLVELEGKEHEIFLEPEVLAELRHLLS